MTDPVDDLLDIETGIDDCWNRIGTRGDQSCPVLVECTRCLNCPVFERAAARLLDRPVSDSVADAAAGAPREAPRERSADARAVVLKAGNSGSPGASGFTQSSETLSAVVFRVADEWLALPTETLKQIEETRPVHSLPHRRNRVVPGLVNVRGVLTVVVSLGELLRLDLTSAARAASNRAEGAVTAAVTAPGAGPYAVRSGGYARMLVVAHECEPVVFPVDEVHGVVRYAVSALKPVPDTLTRSSAAHAAGVLAWQGKTVGVLDAARVFASLMQSLQ